jgi:hypothetical protein
VPPRVDQLAALLGLVLREGSRPEIIEARAVMAAWLIRLQDRAEELLSASIAHDDDLLTAREAARATGPSWTAKKLYRLRGSMPQGITVRKGGRLYFRALALRSWLRTR